MKATTKAIIAGGIAIAASIALIAWQMKHGGAHAVNLTPEDLSLIAESMQPQVRASLASDPEDRKKLAKELRELLAMAEAARADGIADRPEVRRQLDLMRNFVLAQTYAQSQREGGKPAAELYTKEEVEAYLKESGNEERFNQLISDVKKLNPEQASTEIPEQQKEQLKQQWGAGQVLARKAMAAGADSSRKTQLQVQLQQANFLSKLYSDELAKKIQPTDKEIDDYFANHPEQDPKKAREKAEGILQRAKAGEDFEALAKEFSDEPGAKERGGELPWFGRTEMVKPFSDAAFAMKEGDISDIVETQYGYHIIKVTGRRTEKGASGEPEEQVQARHILIKPNTANENPFAPPVSPREAAKNAILEEKRKAIVEQVVKNSKIQVPDDFPVKPPEQPAAQPPSPHGDVEMPPAEEELPEQPDAKGGTGETKGGAKPKSGKK